jgi:hypothetical protein
VKGEHKGLSGAQYNYETVNVRPGKAPDTVWLALSGYQGDLALVALVGFHSTIVRFARRVAKVKPIPIVVLQLPGIPDSLSFAVATAGMWPEARVKAVVRQLSGNGSNSWRGWAKEYLRLNSDPERAEVGAADEALAKELAQLFAQQCMEAERLGRS